MIPASIDNKKFGISLFGQGFFGNTLRQWQTFADLMEDSYNGPIVIRSRAAHGGGPCTYNVPKIDVLGVLGKEPWKDWPIENTYFNELLPPHLSTLQAELMTDVDGMWYMRYSLEKVYFREALSRPIVARGLKAKMIVQHFCCVPMFDCVQEFMDCYKDHVIELTCTSKSFGSRGWNGIIWEVRKY